MAGGVVIIRQWSVVIGSLLVLTIFAFSTQASYEALSPKPVQTQVTNAVLSPAVSGFLDTGTHKITQQQAQSFIKSYSRPIFHIVTGPAPPITITSPQESTIYDTHVGTSNPILVTGSVARGTANIVAVKVSIDSLPFELASGTNTWSFTTLPLTTGIHTITAQAIFNDKSTSTASVNISVVNFAPLEDVQPTYSTFYGDSTTQYTNGFVMIKGGATTVADLSQYNQEIPQQIMLKGQPVSITVKTFTGYNPVGVNQITLFYMPQGGGDMTPNLNDIASIRYDAGQQITVTDPLKIISNEKVTMTCDGTYQFFTFQFTPLVSYEKMSFLFRMVNDKNFQTDVRVHDAYVPPKKSAVLPKGVMAFNDTRLLDDQIEAQDDYMKPNLISHVSTSSQVFDNPSQGHIVWYYDTRDHSVSRVIFDGNGNTLSYIIETLSKQHHIPMTQRSHSGEHVEAYSWQDYQCLYGKKCQ